MADQEHYYQIEGGKPLRGTVVIGGGKNAVTKQFVASLLTTEQCTFTNVPEITEIKTVLEMLSEIGMVYEWVDRNKLVVQTPYISVSRVRQQYGQRNRIPILLLGPLLHRAGRAHVPIMGGCKIGSRPVDLHIKALAALGAAVTVTQNSYIAEAERLRGANIVFDFPSVGATETAILGAVLARGITVIHNAAIEPEIIDTILFLQKMGARIMFDVDRKIIIEGVGQLRGASHHTITDRIEAASFAIAAVATGGRIRIENARQEDLITLLGTIRKAGGEFCVGNNEITFSGNPELRPMLIETNVHPGFMTDWQQPFTILQTQANGASVIHETVYENRFGFVETLVAMGANITLSQECLSGKPCRFYGRNYLHSCTVSGPTKLSGCKIVIPDLRAGFAHIIAALLAKGVSEIRGINHIERGYAEVPEKLRAIGATIKVI